MKYDVFISYSSHDQKVVEGLCAYLEQHKIRCFVAYRDIPRGVVWARAIVEALDESRMMVVVFSEHFNNSDQVDREIELASEDKKPILTFRITNDAFKGAKKYYLKNINWIDAFPNPEQVFGSLANNVARLLGLDLEVAKPTPTPRPIPAPQPTPAKTYKIGDYYDDGKKQGVVFEVSADGKHGKIVSLTESQPIEWAKDKSHGYLWERDEHVKLFVGAESKYDGAYNMEKVKQIANWREKYPAFAWCADLGNDWYLPAIEELKSFTFNGEIYDAINHTLAVKGKELANKGVNHRYWSSTEICSSIINLWGKFFVWAVNMDDDESALDYRKDLDACVRAVATF